MGCPKLHITEHKLLPDTTPSSPLKQNFKGSKNRLSHCKPTFKTCTGSYRFSFNGQEQDNEISGNGNSYTAEFWQYDARLGRRWNVDPVVRDYESPFISFSNNPIYYLDPKGDNRDNYHIFNDGTVKVERTEDKTNTYTYHDDKGNTFNLGTYDVKKDQKVNNGNNNADLVDFTGLNKIFIETKTIESGNYYLDEDAAARLLAGAYSFYNQENQKVYINQLSGLKGQHSGTYSNRYGLRVDLQYPRTDGVAGRSYAGSNDYPYNESASQTLVDALIDFGMNSSKILTQKKGTSKAALDNTTYYSGHYNHIHMTCSNNVIEITSKQAQELLSSGKKNSSEPNQKNSNKRSGNGVLQTIENIIMFFEVFPYN